jgi:predicted transposase YdaD
MMYLPPELDEKLINRLEEYEEEKKMPYVTRMERRARNEGHQEGWEEGREEGREEEAARVLRRLVKRRFGGVPQWAEEKLSSADAEQLEEWAEELVIADSLEDVFGKRD